MFEARERGRNCFVQYNNGLFKNFKSLVLIRGIGQSPHLLADKQIRIYTDDIICYQNEDHFALSADGFLKGGHNSKIASETLPGFAVRIMKGKLNIYVKKYKSGPRVVDEFFFQGGNQREVIVYTPDLMESLIRKMPQALEFYNEYKKQLPKTKELIATAHIFNHTYLASKK
jgi:hypothetical protein